MRVQEALTYLATALPRFTSPAARMLALQCALRADTHGHARLPAGLLRSMRLHGRTEIWEELAHAAWLHSPDLRSTPVEVQLLDAAILEQVPGRRARCRAAHWALRPTPLHLSAASPPALRLITLVLAAHTGDRTVHSVDMDVLTRLSGHSTHQLEELLDRLVAVHALAAWHHNRYTDEVLWQPFVQHSRVGPAARRPRPIIR
ncbi:hypothetical protein ACIF83_36015 [Streptomyces sp. NPDC085866]|uniref:hypothetical protein n=1 Tax=Streptomyces sp. NPDC085866 TaxID=3365736 RepID=UPI0037D7E1FD